VLAGLAGSRVAHPGPAVHPPQALGGSSRHTTGGPGTECTEGALTLWALPVGYPEVHPAALPKVSPTEGTTGSEGERPGSTGRSPWVYPGST